MAITRLDNLLISEVI